ncbi:MAG TPA: GNAT family N-acetyltransferase [Roseiflexaceae bacterium]|nr:GNAT family N-acetyltransferase [Roseiflexaceae bacterium]
MNPTPPFVRAIAAADTRPLRHALLRPHQPPEALVYPGDDDPLALHAGAFVDDALVGIASVAPGACPLVPADAPWRLRGMAVMPAMQRRGLGAALIHACVEHILANGGTLLWCNGRTSALPFYRSLGFAPIGEEFVDPDTGPHYVLWRAL